jgi:hypothetical protein
MTKEKLTRLLQQPLDVVNIGLPGFADGLRSQGIQTLHVDWRPPAGGNMQLADLLSRLETKDSAGAQKIEQANQEGLKRILAADPVLVDVVPAGEAIPQLQEQQILHAGPPIAWDRMCGPMRGAVTGIAVFEGWADTLDSAGKLAAEGAFTFCPNHDFGAVGPMTGMTTLSQPVMVVENRAFGNRAYCALNEGLGRVMRFGGNDAQVLNRLAWLRDEFGPALGRALRATDGISLKRLIARGLGMGDEMHQRNLACSALILRELAAAMVRTGDDKQKTADALAFMSSNDQFFLNIAMAMGKSIMDPVKGIEGCCLVTAMCRNGTDFGIRVSATGDQWFTAPTQMPEGLYFPGYSAADANPDMGDSTIVETVGLGGFAMGAAPAVAGFVGAGAASDAAGFTRTMAEITVGENPEWTIPAMDYAGVPTGIDIRRVVETGLAPIINTGIAHKKPGVGQVGAGVVRAPIPCFEQALAAFAKNLGVS